MERPQRRKRASCLPPVHAAAPPLGCSRTSRLPALTAGPRTLQTAPSCSAGSSRAIQGPMESRAARRPRPHAPHTCSCHSHFPWKGEGGLDPWGYSVERPCVTTVG